jgi:hypothetical protein
MDTKIKAIINVLESAAVMSDFATRDEVLAGIYHECEVVHAGDMLYKTVSTFMYATTALLHIKTALRQCVERSYELELKA